MVERFVNIFIMNKDFFFSIAEKSVKTSFYYIYA